MTSNSPTPTKDASASATPSKTPAAVQLESTTDTDTDAANTGLNDQKRSDEAGKLKVVETVTKRKYAYEHLEQFFSVSTWNEDIKGSFGLKPNFGWPSFRATIQELKDGCRAGESIKVIYAGRHGHGVHNTLSKALGIDEYFVHRTNGDIDPLLTDLGRSQATALAVALQRETAPDKGMPMPEKYYVSPLKRCGETCGLEWGWAFSSDTNTGGTPTSFMDGSVDMGHGVPAIVIENIREHLHAHRCDARAPKSELMELFPSFQYPTDMSEEDVLWQPFEVRGRETEEELVARAGKGLEECLELSGDTTYLSITSHSGALRGMTTYLGMPERRLKVGEMNVFVLKVKEIQDV